MSCYKGTEKSLCSEPRPSGDPRFAHLPHNIWTPVDRCITVTELQPLLPMESFHWILQVAESLFVGTCTSSPSVQGRACHARAVPSPAFSKNCLCRMSSGQQALFCLPFQAHLLKLTKVYRSCSPNYVLLVT